MRPARSRTSSHRIHALAGTLALGVALALVGCGDSPPASEPDATMPTGPVVEVAAVGFAVLERPVDLTTRAGDDRLYVAEKVGRVRTVSAQGDVAEQPFLDIADRVSSGGEQGLLGIAFTADGARLYVHYSDLDGNGRLASWKVVGGELDPASEVEHAVVEQPYPNHNGGQIQFGPDGYLYWALGDGGAGGDPEGRAQDLASPLGKILRIEPTPDGPQPYRVPEDNPFVGTEGARPEIWMLGLRNPWRFSFDGEGGIWIGDVGQGALEEVDYLAAGDQAGANLGWDAMEGTQPFEGEPSPEYVAPVFEYSHDIGISITGGLVYRGSEIASLRGRYLFGDYGSGLVWSLARGADGWVAEPLPVEVPSLAAFGEDAAGEVYLLSLDGPVYKLLGEG